MPTRKAKVIEVEGRHVAADEIKNTEVAVLENVTVEIRPTQKGLVAYAAFDCNGAHYEPGDAFTPPAGWTRNTSYDEFRGIQVKNKAGKEIGTAFTTPTGLQIVPVKEA